MKENFSSQPAQIKDFLSASFPFFAGPSKKEGFSLAVSFLQRRQLRLLTGEQIELRAVFHDRKQGLPARRFVVTRRTKPEAIASWIQEREAGRYNIYFSIQPIIEGTVGFAKDKDVAAFKHLVLDFDAHQKTISPEALKAQAARMAEACPGFGVPRPCTTVFSGHGFWFYWETKHTPHTRETETVYRKAIQSIALRLTGEIRLGSEVMNPARIARLPGTLNFRDISCPVRAELLFDATPGSAEDREMTWSEVKWLVETTPGLVGASPETEKTSTTRVSSPGNVSSTTLPKGVALRQMPSYVLKALQERGKKTKNFFITLPEGSSTAYEGVKIQGQCVFCAGKGRSNTAWVLSSGSYKCEHDYCRAAKGRGGLKFREWAPKFFWNEHKITNETEAQAQWREKRTLKASCRSLLLEVKSACSSVFKDLLLEQGLVEDFMKKHRSKKQRTKALKKYTSAKRAPLHHQTRKQTSVDFDIMSKLKEKLQLLKQLSQRELHDLIEEVWGSDPSFRKVRVPRACGCPGYTVAFEAVPGAAGKNAATLRGLHREHNQRRARDGKPIQSHQLIESNKDFCDVTIRPRLDDARLIRRIALIRNFSKNRSEDRCTGSTTPSP